MNTIVSKSVIKAEFVDSFLDTVTELIEKSRKEPGCISYDLYNDKNNRYVFTFIEQWADENAIKMHNESEHFKTIVPKLSQMRESSELNIYKKVK